MTQPVGLSQQTPARAGRTGPIARCAGWVMGLCCGLAAASAAAAAPAVDAAPAGLMSRCGLGLLGYRPFLEPAPIDRYWLWMLPPLVIGIAVVYRTIKSDDLDRMPRRAAYLAFQVAVFLVAASVTLWVLLRIF